MFTFIAFQFSGKHLCLFE